MGTTPRIGTGPIAISTESSVAFCQSSAARLEAAGGSKSASPPWTADASNSARPMVTLGWLPCGNGSRTISRISGLPRPQRKVNPARLKSDFEVSLICIMETASGPPFESAVFTKRHPPGSSVVRFEALRFREKASSHRCRSLELPAEQSRGGSALAGTNGKIESANIIRNRRDRSMLRKLRSCCLYFEIDLLPVLAFCLPNFSSLPAK